MRLLEVDPLTLRNVTLAPQFDPPHMDRVPMMRDRVAERACMLALTRQTCRIRNIPEAVHALCGIGLPLQQQLWSAAHHRHGTLDLHDNGLWLFRW